MAINKKTVAALQKQLKSAMTRIAAERDGLGEMISEFEALRDSCDRAFQDLDNARDALSELV